MPPDAPPLLEVGHLAVHYRARGATPWRTGATVRAVDDVSFAIGRGETLGLVGESGCGKSTVGRAIVRLLKPEAGRILFEGEDIARLGPRALRRRRHRFQIVFQDPAGALDPRMTLASLLAEPLQIAGLGRDAIRRRVDELLDVVALDPDGLRRYPHEFSGGQKQRIGIARALALEPRLVVCDEPVSALDVSVQAQILNLLKDIQERNGISYLFIAHDLGVVRQVSHRVAVMYLGRIVELAPRGRLFAAPKHPYTRALLAAAPRVIGRGEMPRDARPGAAPAQEGGAAIGGELPDPLAPPGGCRFRTRCPLAEARCAEAEPALGEAGPSHLVACHFAPAG